MIRPTLPALAALLAVSGCGGSIEISSEPTTMEPGKGVMAVAYHVDPETGCEYIRRGKGLAPRYSADGVTVRGCRDSGEAD